MKYCTNGLKSVARRTLVLIDKCWKKKPWKLKKHLNNDEFLTFTLSKGWLDKWKISYGIREKRVNGEVGEVSGGTVNAWTERLWQLTKDYDPVDI